MSQMGGGAGGTEREGQGEPLAAAPAGESEPRQEAHVPDREPRTESPAQEYHAGPPEAAAPQERAPIAHFEPSPKPDPGANKPYVVWSSAPSEKSSGGREPEE